MDTKSFYVSAIDGQKKYLIAGPYASHTEALEKVDAVNKRACELDARACFMAWGTAKAPVQKTPMGAF